MRRLNQLSWCVGVLLVVGGVVAAQEASDAGDGGGSFEARARGAEVAAAGLDPAALNEMDVMFQSHVEAGHVAGVVAMIVRNGTPGYIEAFGHRDIAAGAPMKRDSLVRIYSMTKPIVAAAAMSLWEEGLFDLDDPIGDHLPEWSSVAVKGTDEPAVLITPRHLMTHTSGLSYDGIGRDPRSLSLDEFSKTLASRPLEFQPGSAYRYGYSTDVLGRYLEVVAGKSLDRVLRERLFDPLGMDDTEFWVRSDEDRSRTAEVYTKRDGALSVAMDRDELFARPPSMLGGQGLVSTADDYAKFCAMLLGRGELNGVRVLKGDTVDLMFDDHIDAFDGEYGLGAWADGGGVYAWSGYAGTTFWVDRNTKSFAVYIVQRVWYHSPTEQAFKDLAKRAVLVESEVGE